MGEGPNVNWALVIETADLTIEVRDKEDGSFGQFTLKANSRPASIRDVAIIAYVAKGPQAKGYGFAEPAEAMKIVAYHPERKRLVLQFTNYEYGGKKQYR